MSTTQLTTCDVDEPQLNDRQRRFVAEYLVSLNGADAARRAGYAHAKVAAARLLKNPQVAAAIGNVRRNDLERLELTRERILQELACIALRDVADLCDEDGIIRINDLRQLPERVRRCVDSIKCKQHTDADGNISQSIELKLAPKNAAVELAMKHFGLLSDKQAANAVPIVRLSDLCPRPSKPNPVEQRILAVEQLATDQE